MCGCEKNSAQSGLFINRLNDDQNEAVQALYTASCQLRQQAILLDSTNEYVRNFFVTQEVLTKNQKALIIETLSKFT